MSSFAKTRLKASRGFKQLPKGKILACMAIITFMVMMLVKPDYYLDSARRGLSLFATSVLPSLFPFYFFSLLLTYIGAAKTVSGIFQKPVRVLYNAPKESAYVLLLSMLSGYPVGASMTAELYEAGSITQKEAKAIAAFASTSGPIFMLGTVGSAIFGNVKVGIVVLAAHYIAALLNGFIFRVRKNSGTPKMLRKDKASNNGEELYKDIQIMTSDRNDNRKSDSAEIMSTKGIKSLGDDGVKIMSRQDQDSIMSHTIASSTLSMLYVGGYIVLCGMLADTVALFGLDNLLLTAIGEQASQVVTALVYGLIEMTRGSIACADCELFHIGVALCSAIISFGGLSVMLQNYTFLSKCDMRFSAIALRKLTQSVIAFSLALGFSYLI